jgi:hypothetical protein
MDSHQSSQLLAATAATVRVQDGTTLRTDRPFVETREELCGSYLFEADDLDAARGDGGSHPDRLQRRRGRGQAAGGALNG